MAIFSKSPNLGRPQEYKTKYYGRFIPANYGPSTEYRVEVTSDNQLHNTKRRYNGKDYVSIFGGKWSKEVDLHIFCFPLPGQPIGPAVKNTEEPIPFVEENNPPWSPKMPWTFHDELLQACGLNRYQVSNGNLGLGPSKYGPPVTLPKLTLLPIDSASFSLKILHVECKPKVYLECLVYGVPNKEMPFKFWIDEEWVQPHTGKSEEEEANERIRAAVNRVRTKFNLKK